MKKNFYILLVIFLYLECLCFAAVFIAINASSNESSENSELIVNMLFISQILFSLTALVFGILGVTTFRPSKFNNDYKFIMTIKLILIPFYVLNYAMYFVLILGTLITLGTLPFGIILLIIVVPFTYLTILFTSFPITFMSIKNIKEKKDVKKNVLIIIFSVLFCLDVVAGIIAYKNNKIKQEV